MRATASLLDSSAIALSGLCLLHCLALPLLAATLPLLGAWSRAEWIHVMFATAAVPLSGYALWSTHRRHALPAPVWSAGAVRTGRAGDWSERSGRRCAGNTGHGRRQPAAGQHASAQSAAASPHTLLDLAVKSN